MVNIFATIAIIIHLYIFWLESFLWGRPKTNRIFGITTETAEHTRLMAFNQGFYNLFLALGALAGLAIGLDNPIGKALITFSLGSMLAAAAVLIYSNPKLLRAAIIQGLAPLVSLIGIYLF